ncbi:MAG: 50S ribosomal protein L18 [Candidatus Roizmanbacteria bacterium GW2011_GWA2_36_23]|uniref:Large ribosomal subunit protein uL18 n=1 Tax=Candidatus Roizmanbacteria bacterium GW2011_GWA2_36_23 TaxID=1618480 RepID=A0A0G0GQU3_9BACT|nr:MAG: 50S ribosomal protein L18 [Candidatus Roizmanbacteria bacterium GW2011_GWA2_36_23]
MSKIFHDRKLRRKKRISTHFFGTADRPRVSIYRSNKYTYAQAIDDDKRTTLVLCSSLLLKKFKDYKKAKKTDEAKQVGILMANQLKEKQIMKVIFDRSSYNYKGRVKALAEGLREAGIQV